MRLHQAKQRTEEPKNNEPQNFEGWFRFAQSFLKIDRSTQSLDPEALEGKLTTGRSTQKLTAGRIPYFDIRPARNALKLVRGEFNNLIHNSRITLTQRTMHGRRVFAFSEFLTPCCQKNLLKGLK